MNEIDKIKKAIEGKPLDLGEEDYFSSGEKPKQRKIKERIDRLKDELTAENFKEETNNNPLLKEQKIRAVNSNTYGFFKFMSFLFFILLLGSVFVFGYLIYEGKLQSTYEMVINPMFNATVNVENDFDFSHRLHTYYTLYINFTTFE